MSAAERKSIDQTPQWSELQQHYQTDLEQAQLKDLFAEQPERGTTMAAEHDGLYLDYSKNILLPATIDIMCRMLKAIDINTAINDMMSGAKINTAENRAVLHTALRAPSDAEVMVDGTNVVAQVQQVQKKMSNFAQAVRSGQWTGYSGKPITTVVHIGIGGSEIGPHMAAEALADYADGGISALFVSNVDPADFQAATNDLDPQQTLFVVVSKTFTTIETLSNASCARDWLLQAAPDDSAVRQHFVAISSNVDGAVAFGIDPTNVFEMWDWVGGRYSLMSAVGLTNMILIGPERFSELLRGARSIDEHFHSAPLERNIPVLLACISTLYSTVFGSDNELILPYSSRLGRLTTYLQQANMESNGKSVRHDGTIVGTATGPIVWGTPGTDAQHTFMQHVHQGTQTSPADVILFKQPFKDANNQHRLLLANALAQTEALAFGKDDQALRSEGVDETLIPHKRMPGNRPSNILLFDKLTPYSFGQLVAVYEHKIFTQGVMWNINSFDQWGVELGKKLATAIVDDLDSRQPNQHDSSTDQLINKLRS